ncbi:glycosyltransferase family 4 protein [Kocuria sp. KRD140]|uniref:glycosyltransferase family 4 protein n=1 Tax=Kocuria sp. KRD140 TaxID=2729723 RepID=UPI001F497127|nr:glycosyltransferase family 4 protein [Kocuria sp. KRD140]
MASSYWPEHSPPQRRWYSLVSHLRERGWTVSVVCPVAHYGAGPDYSTQTRGRAWRRQAGFLGEHIYRVPYVFLGDNRAGKLLDQLVSAAASVGRGLFTGRQNVVVVTAPSLPLLASALLVARVKGIPLVVEMRDAWPNLAEDASLVRGGSKSVVNRAVVYVQNRADLVVTVTQGFARTLRERGVHNVVTVRNGILLERTPQLPPPPARRRGLRVLYLGNHGESQSLDRLIRAAHLAGDSVHLTLVGHGSRKPALQQLAHRLGANVEFLPPEYRERVFERYRDADSVVISLRDDWKSFEDTIPSKTYEVLAVGRHITAVVRGEAAHVLTDAGEGDIVASDPEQIAALWRALEADRSRLVPSGSGREWVRHNADYADLSVQYDQHLRATVREYSRVCGQGVLPRLGRVLRAVTRGVAGAGSRESPFTARTADGGAAQGRPAAEADSGTPDTDHASRRQGVADGGLGGVERMAS